MTATLPEMSLPEWLVLTILSQQPAHGFAVAQLTAADGELGRVWQIPEGGRLPGDRPPARRGVHRPRGHRARPRPPAHRLQRDGRRPRSRRPLAARAGRARAGDPLGAAAQARPPRPRGRRPGEPAAGAARGARADRRRDRVAARAQRGVRRDAPRLAPRERGGRAGLPGHDRARRVPRRSRAAASAAFRHREEAVRGVVVRRQLPAGGRRGPAQRALGERLVGESAWPCRAASAARPDG